MISSQLPAPPNRSKRDWDSSALLAVLRRHPRSYRVKASDVMWCDVTWRDVMWCDVVWCDVMWYDVLWCGVMWCDVVWWDVTWCDAMWCDVMWYDVMWWGSWEDEMSGVKCWSLWILWGRSLHGEVGRNWILWGKVTVILIWWRDGREDRNGEKGGDRGVRVHECDVRREISGVERMGMVC